MASVIRVIVAIITFFPLGNIQHTVTAIGTFTIGAAGARDLITVFTSIITFFTIVNDIIPTVCLCAVRTTGIWPAVRIIGPIVTFFQSLYFAISATRRLIKPSVLASKFIWKGRNTMGFPLILACANTA